MRATRRVRGGGRRGERGPAPPRWCRRSGCWRCARRGGGTGRARRRDGPAAQRGRAGLSRAAPLRHQTAAASRQAAGAEQPAPGGLVSRRRGFASAASGHPIRPRQWSAVLGRGECRWAVPQSRLHPASPRPLRPPGPQVEAEPEESRGVSSPAGSTAVSPGRGGGSRPPRTEKSARGAGAAARPRLLCPASAGPPPHTSPAGRHLAASASSVPPRVLGRKQGAARTHLFAKAASRVRCSLCGGGAPCHRHPG